MTTNGTTPPSSLGNDGDDTSTVPIRAVAGRRVILPILARQRRHLAAALLAVALSAVATGAIPVLIEQSIDAAADGDRPALIDAAASFGLVTLAGALVSGVRVYLVVLIGQQALHDLRLSATRSLAALPIGRFERLRRGDVVARVTSDVERLEDTVSDGVPFVVSAGVSAVASYVGLAIVSPTIALISLVVMPPFLAAARWLVHRSREVYPHARRINGEMVAELAETFEGAATIRAFRRSHERRTRFMGTNRRAGTAALDGMRMRVRFYAAVTLTQSAVIALVVAASGYLALDGRLGVGVVAAAVVGVTRVFEPLADLVEYTDDIQSARAALDRVAGLVELDNENRPDDIVLQPVANTVPSIPGRPRGADVELTDVSFGYTQDRHVLHGIDLRLPAGSTTAIVGPTGAGKSTLARLITGLAEPSTGAVHIGGTTIAGLPPTERRHLAVAVLQEHFCIEGTLADNLLLADPDATDEDLIAALDHTGNDWWRQLPAGLDTRIGAGGHGLSGGQRQLLSLARIALLDPCVIVLDEATSLLDPDTEADVAAAHARTLDDRTVVIIAHRRTTAERCQRIIHVDRGFIVGDTTSSQRAANPAVTTDATPGLGQRQRLQK